MSRQSLFLLICIFLTAFQPCIQAQNCDTNDCDQDLLPIAYVDSTSITKLAAYIPVAALIVAAILLSQSDRRNDHSSCSYGSYTCCSYDSSYCYYRPCYSSCFGTCYGSSSSYCGYSSYSPYSYSCWTRSYTPVHHAH